MARGAEAAVVQRSGAHRGDAVHLRLERAKRHEFAKACRAVQSLGEEGLFRSGNGGHPAIDEPDHADARGKVQPGFVGSGGGDRGALDLAHGQIAGTRSGLDRGRAGGEAQACDQENGAYHGELLLGCAKSTSQIRAFLSRRNVQKAHS